MNKRKTIFTLLKSLSLLDPLPKVRIIGSITGGILYEGSVFDVPFSRCSDYVLKYETCGDEMVITSTFLSY